MVAAVRGSFPHMGGIHDDDDEMYDEAGRALSTRPGICSTGCCLDSVHPMT